MSKTDHARLPGTHRAGHEHTGKCVGCDYCAARPRTSARVAIAEGLAEFATPLDMDERFTVRECMDQFEALDQWHDGDDLRMADWEVALETGIEQDEARDLAIVWTTASADAWIAHENLRSLEREAAEDEAWESLLDYECWLAPVSTAELFDLFPDGGFTVESPSVYEPSGKAHAHMRVYELAREVGINSDHMVEYLRIFGEWVESHTSYVALPVCERVLDLADDLIAEYGLRTTPKTWAQERAEWDLAFGVRR